MSKLLKQVWVLALIVSLLPTMMGQEVHALEPVEYLNPIDEMSQIVEVLAEDGSVFAIDDNKVLWSWGTNWNGQLGDGTMNSRSTPKKIMVDVIKIFSSHEHIFENKSLYAIKSDGTLWSWGNNKYGQLGDGTTTNRSRPVKVLENVTSVTANDDSTFAITTDGSLWSWGANWNGQLGMEPPQIEADR